MAWTAAEVLKYVKASLGAPKRALELDDTQITQALRRAVRYWGTKKPSIRKDFLVINNGQQKYDLTALSKPFGKGLINVYQEPVTSPQSVFNEFEYYRLRQPPYVDITELVLDQIYYKEIGYVTGTQFQWEWIQDQSVLLVAPIPSRTYNLGYDYVIEPGDIGDVLLNDQGWVVDYTLALTKQMLGMVRRKFKGVPGNELAVDTDGDDLVREGKEEQEALKEGLQGTVGAWTPPIKG